MVAAQDRSGRLASAEDVRGAPAGGEEQFRALLELAPDAMVIVDHRGVIRLINAQTEEMFGYRRGELLGRPVEIMLPKRFRADHPGHRQAYAASQQVRPMGAGLELRGLRRDGAEFPVEISLSPVQTSDGLLVSAAIRDVSERKAAEHRISELVMIAVSSRDAILTKTLDGVITFWNAAAERMYGYTAQEAVGRHVSMLAPPGRKGEIDELLARIRRGERVEHYETLRMTRGGKLLEVEILLNPVRARSGAIVGACVIARDISERKRAEHELTRLYEQQRHVALTLQRALMGSPPPVQGLATVGRYLPATRGAGVGGDWFDLIPLGAGRIGVLIGDVMGRGLEAATVMGQLRSAANAVARTGMPPQQLMDALDAVVADLPGQLVTCCYMVINTSQGEVTASSAGHLPVLLVRPDGSAGRLQVPVSVPLGVGGIPHGETTLQVPFGSTLVLYTDGLVETRDGDVGDQIDTLHTQACTIIPTASSLDQAADSILSALLPYSGEPADDVTLLLVRTPGAPRASAGTMIYPGPQHVAGGRRFVRDTLDAWNQAELAPTACLLVSELLTNAMRHTSEPIGLRLHHTEHEIIAEISDDHPQLPRRTLTAPADEDGRGLTLVEALADRWGSLPANGSKIVWFALATDGSARRERYLTSCRLPVRRRRSYLLGEYARCFQRREMARRRHHPQAHLVEEVTQPVRPLGGEQRVVPRPQHRRGYVHPAARRRCLLSHRMGDRASTSPVPADGRDEGPRRRVEPGNTIEVCIAELKLRPGPVRPEMRQVGADRVGPAIDELLGQIELVEGLIPEFALRRGAEDTGADAGQRRRDDQAAQQAGPVGGDSLRNPAADVIAGDHQPVQTKFLDQGYHAAGLSGSRVRGRRVLEMLV